MTETGNPDEGYQRALALYRAGDVVGAGNLCTAILRRSPDHFETLHFAGILDAQQRRLDSALALLDRALRVRPASAEVLANRANVLNLLGRHREAQESAERAAALSPHSVEAQYNVGLALQSLGRPADALACYERALAIRPDFVPALLNRGAALQAMRRHNVALASFERVLAVNPNHVEAHYNRGVVLQQLQRYVEALQCHERALALRPTFAQAHNNRGLNLYMLGRLEDAKASYDRALALRPDFAEALFNRGAVLSSLRRHEAAAADFERAIALAPGLPYAMGALLHARMHCCDWRTYERDVAATIDAVREGKPVAEPFTLLNICDSPDDQRRCSETYAAERFAGASAPATFQRREGERIRVAYLSADFHDHATAQLMAGVFERHDRRRFETFAISFGPDRRDAMRGRLVAAFDAFIDVRTLDDRSAAARLTSLGIDIAVDLKGYTDNARTGILALRPAPIQVSYLGYPGTMGAPFIDYLIADRIVVPAEEQSAYSEKIVYLPDSYQANDILLSGAAEATRRPHGLPEGAIVFCAFHPPYKVTPAIFDVWMRLLHDVEGSVLWLLEGGETAAANLRAEAQRRGVRVDRLCFAPRLPHDQHLARVALADLFLDTFPCNAHTTASDALRVGLPIVTCAGHTFAARVAASLLHAIGVTELVTDNLGRYEALARGLAYDSIQREQVRMKIAAQRHSAPLFDHDRFRRHLESAYETMWARWRRGEAPETFAVPAVA